MANQQVFLERPEEELTQSDYQALSPLAVVALLLGVGSSLVLISPLFLMVPGAAVVAAFVSLRQISANPDLTGRRVALAAVVLAALFAAWTPSYIVLRNVKLNHEARAFSSAWLNLISQGRYYEAHQWSEPYDSRLSTSEGIEEVYLKDGKLLQAYEQYFDNSPFDVHAAPTPELTFEYLGDENIQVTSGELAVITQRFRINYRVDGVTRSEVVLLTARRGVYEKGVFWQLFDLKTSS